RSSTAPAPRLACPRSTAPRPPPSCPCRWTPPSSRTCRARRLPSRWPNRFRTGASTRRTPHPSRCGVLCCAGSVRGGLRGVLVHQGLVLVVLVALGVLVQALELVLHGLDLFFLDLVGLVGGVP